MEDRSLSGVMFLSSPTPPSFILFSLGTTTSPQKNPTPKFVLNSVWGAVLVYSGHVGTAVKFFRDMNNTWESIYRMIYIAGRSALSAIHTARSETLSNLSRGKLKSRCDVHREKVETPRMTKSIWCSSREINNSLRFPAGQNQPQIIHTAVCCSGCHAHRGGKCR